MTQRASDVGELAFRILGRRRPGTVTRAFQSAAYVRSANDFLVVLWGRLRSPLTVNVVGEADQEDPPKVGERCALGPEMIRLGENSIDVSGARVYMSGLRERRAVVLPPAKDLTRGVAMAKSLYEVSPAGPTLATDRALRAFVDKAVAPLAAGEPHMVHRKESFAQLIGRGGGFTPAGDDFLGGFTATYNYFARCKGSREISIPRKMLFAKTIPESAAILGYATKGYVDEVLERLILNTLGGVDFLEELLALGHRGHTSGIDMSLGVLLSVAAISDSEQGGGALKECSAALWHQ